MTLIQQEAQALLADVDDFTRDYLIAALWLASGGDYYVDELWDIHPVSILRAIRDCKDFQRANAVALVLAYQSDGYNKGNAGQDFFLTRNGHGAGFWDRGLEEKVGGALTEACGPYGEADLYMGDDGYLHFGGEKE